ncbi:MAG TPA: hypothetical protein GX517_08815 [Alicyclobacillus sp.]|nr:hypothetical protein [Alicyclobacillus sp.]
MNDHALPRLSLDDIGVEYRELVTTQEYGPKPRIEGVQILDLRWFTDDGGAFTELARLDEQGCLAVLPEFQVRQVNYSVVLPGAVKAWHLHFNQEDVWFIPPTVRLLVGLLDVRTSSPTYRNTMRFVMGAGKAQVLYIPRGVAHGVANIWAQDAYMMYLVNQQFDPEKPDENRLPWDVLGDSFWQIQKG